MKRGAHNHVEGGGDSGDAMAMTLKVEKCDSPLPLIFDCQRSVVREWLDI